jgi:RNA polymerase sigma-70 factor (ECF subfamily)
MLLLMKPSVPDVNTERIWRELRDRLRRFIRSRVTSDADVDDILQDVFLRIHQHLAGLRSADRLESWVFQITRNAVADHFRRQKRHEQHDVDRIVAESDEPENLRSELSDCLASLIGHLPPDQQRAVSLYELEGVSQADIAQRESLSLSGAKSRIQRGRQKLEEMLLDCCRFELDARGNVLEYEATDPSCGCGEECD